MKKNLETYYIIFSVFVVQNMFSRLFSKKEKSSPKKLKKQLGNLKNFWKCLTILKLVDALEMFENLEFLGNGDML